MKFISWNVNGLRACLQKGWQDFFDRENADFFCLQETKLQEGQVTLELPGYQQFWCCAEKKGYSGTAIFAKQPPLSVSYGLGIPELDTEGRLITLARDSQESSPAPQFKNIDYLALSFPYSPTFTSIHDHWKNHSLTRQTFVGKVMSLLFNMLFRFVIAFLSRSKRLNFTVAVTICSDFEA